MTIARLAFRRGLAALTLGLLAGCGTPAGSAGPATTNVLPQGSAPAAASDRAQGDDLLYVSDAGSGQVSIYSYPQLRSEKTFRLSSPRGLCVDRSGNVFVANQQAHEVLEYARGGTQPIAKLHDPGNYPTGCSIDPISGDLAAVNGGSSAGVSIFRHALGAPTRYADRSVSIYFCGYDDKGNLFADGYGPTSAFKFVELPRGGHAFIKIALDQKLHWPGGVQWDGHYMAVSDQGVYGNNSVIYRFAIAGNHGTTIGSTPLLGALEVAQFFIDSARVIGPDSGRESGNGVRIWDYPSGGHPQRSLNGFEEPGGVVISRSDSN
jgi:DNA-binding beta-propeller fold protein YncE